MESLSKCIELKSVSLSNSSSVSVDSSGKFGILGCKREIVLYNFDDQLIVKRLQSDTKWDVHCAVWQKLADASTSKYFMAARNNVCQVFDCGLDGGATPTCVTSLKGHSRSISSQDWSRLRPNLLATCCIDGAQACCVWDLRAPTRPAVILQSVLGASEVRWSDGCEHQLATSHDPDVRIWDLRKERSNSEPLIRLPLKYQTAHLSKIRDLDWSGDLLLTCSQDARVKLWDSEAETAGLKLLAEGATDELAFHRARFAPFRGGIAAVTGFTRRADSLTLWTNRDDCLMRVYSFIGHKDTVYGFDWRQTGHGYSLVSLSRDGTLRIWPIGSELLRQCGSEPAENDGEADGVGVHGGNDPAASATAVASPGNNRGSLPDVETDFLDSDSVTPTSASVASAGALGAGVSIGTSAAIDEAEEAREIAGFSAAAKDSKYASEGAFASEDSAGEGEKSTPTRPMIIASSMAKTAAAAAAAAAAQGSAPKSSSLFATASSSLILSLASQQQQQQQQQQLMQLPQSTSLRSEVRRLAETVSDRLKLMEQTTVAADFDSSGGGGTGDFGRFRFKAAFDSTLVMLEFNFPAPGCLPEVRLLPPTAQSLQQDLCAQLLEALNAAVYETYNQFSQGFVGRQRDVRLVESGLRELVSFCESLPPSHLMSNFLPDDLLAGRRATSHMVGTDYQLPDQNIPFPRTCGASFSPGGGVLVCFRRPLTSTEAAGAAAAAGSTGPAGAISVASDLSRGVASTPRAFSELIATSGNQFSIHHRHQQQHRHSLHLQHHHMLQHHRHQQSSVAGQSNDSVSGSGKGLNGGAVGPVVVGGGSGIGSGGVVGGGGVGCCTSLLRSFYKQLDTRGIRSRGGGASAQQQQQQHQRHHQCGMQTSVQLIDIESLTPVSRALAQRYRLWSGDSIAAACRQNAIEAAGQFADRRPDVVTLWSVLAALSAPQFSPTAIPGEARPWAAVVLSESRIRRLLTGPQRLGDVQTLGMAAYYLAALHSHWCEAFQRQSVQLKLQQQQQQQQHHQLLGQASSVSSIHDRIEQQSSTATAASLAEDPLGDGLHPDHYHTMPSALAGKINLASIARMSQQTARVKAVSDNDVRPQAESSTYLESDTFMRHFEQSRLLNSRLARLINSHLTRYASLLYCWGLHDTRAQLLKQWLFTVDLDLAPTASMGMPAQQQQQQQHYPPPHVSLQLISLRSNSSGSGSGAYSISRRGASVPVSVGGIQIACSVCCRPTRGRLLVCLTCGHGGHPEHLSDWFKTGCLECPTACGCHCAAVQTAVSGR